MTFQQYFGHFLREWQNWNNEYIYACKKYTKIKISKCNRTLKTYR